MKKVLSVLCMALLAGGMIFTSCTKTFTITVNSNNDEWGTVTGGGTYNDQATATLTATPKPGYQFVKWQDGVKQNPYTISVTENATYTAYFEAIPVPPVTAGVKVTFNGSSWDAGNVAGQYYEGTTQSGTPYAGWIVSAQKVNGETYPTSDVATLTGKNTGTFNGTADASNGGIGGGSFNYVEYYNETTLSDNTYTYGDWWAKNITLNVTDFDATALTMSSNVNATMFSAYEAFVETGGAVGVDAASTAPMTETITNVTLTTQSAKGVALKHGAKKLVAVK